MSYLILEGNIIEELIDDFNGGITNAIRLKDSRFSRFVANLDMRFASFVANLDILSAKNKMTLLPGVSADTFDGAVTAAVAKLCLYLAANDIQYALGVVSGTSRAKLFSKSSVT